MQRKIQHYKLNVFIYIACVCVAGTFFLEKMTQCINKYIHKYAKHLLWRKMKRKKKSGDGEFIEKKIIPDGCLRNQPKHSLKRQ